jgi:hypothetical protein
MRRRRLLGRGTAVVAAAGDRCSDRECRRSGAVRCAYIDRHEIGCDTAWCPRHLTSVAGRPYCRRHGAVVSALGEDRDHLGLPDTGSRAASLADWMFGELDPEVTRILTVASQAYERRLVVDRIRLVVTPDRRLRTWMSSWKLVDHRGVVTSVSVEVDESNDSDVLARVDTAPIGHGVPPWIERRVTGLPPGADAEERAVFRNAITQSIEFVIGNPQAVRRGYSFR